MALNLATHIPIIQVQNKANTTPFTYAQPESINQTFVPGAPVMFDGSNPNYVKEWDGTTVAAGTIIGVAESFGQSLATVGAGSPAFPWGSISGVGALQTYGSVPNQPNARNIALGTPVIDGRTLFLSPGVDNVYEAMFDNTAGATGTDYIPTQADIGKSYGLTKDASGGAYFVDKSKATVGTNALVQIVGINSDDGNGTGGFQPNARVRFVFLQSVTAPQF